MIWAILIIVVAFIIDPVIGAVIVGAIVVVSIFAVLLGNKESAEKAEQQEKERIARKEKREKEEEMFLSCQQNLINKYGEPDRTINLNGRWEYQMNRCILIFSQSSVIYIGELRLLFSDIASFNIVDNYQIKHGKVNGTLDTTTNTGSLVKRGAVGALVGGGVGAVIGASSASKSTSLNYSQDDDKIIHDYNLIIKTRDIKNPIVEFHIGDKWKEASEIEAVLDIIVSKR